MSNAKRQKQRAVAASTARPKSGAAQTVLWSLILFLLISFSGGMDTLWEKGCALLAAAVILGLGLTKTFRERLTKAACPAFFAVAAYVLLGGLSTFYALAGKFAISEFSKLLIAFCVYLLVLTRTRQTEDGFRKIASIFASTACIFGILSVDAASASLFSSLFKNFMGSFTQAYAQNGAFQQGVRISTIFGNANIYAGFMAIAVLLSVALVLTSKTRGEYCIAAFLLGMNALCYLLAFSLGSLFMCFIAALFMILLTAKDERMSVFILFSETVVIALVATALSLIGLGKTGMLGFIPLIAVFASGALLWMLDSAVRIRICEKLNKNIRLVVGLITGFIVLTIVYFAIGLHVTGDAVLANGETLSRSVYPAAGQYTMKVNASQPCAVSVIAQNKFDLMKRTSTTLYAGASNGEIAFTVPDGTKIVTINLTGGEGESTVHAVNYTGTNGTQAIPLKYKLLPSIIVNRLQNLGANENAVQRTVFFEDGLKMFRSYPFFGRGLGGFENGVFSVQEFFYETKYAHNHYIQALTDLGIVGFVLFLALLLLSAFTLWRGRKNKEFAAFIPVLAACLFQMAGQGATDVIWSSAVFLPFAFAVLALIVVYFGETETKEEEPNAEKKPKSLRPLQYGICAFAALFLILLSGNLYAKALVSAPDVNLTTLETCMKIDAFEKNDYTLSYVLSAPRSKDQNVKNLAKTYAEKLSHVQSNSIQNSLVRYYFEINDKEKAFQTAANGIAYTKSSPAAWSKMFDNFESAFDPVGTGTMNLSRVEDKSYYVENILKMYAKLQLTDQEQLDDITLSPKNNAFIGKMLAIKPMASDDLDDILIALSSLVFDSKNAADANGDLMPDAITTLSGNIAWAAEGCTVTGPSSIHLDACHKVEGNYRLSIVCDNPKNVKAITINNTAVPIAYTSGEAYGNVKLSDNQLSDTIPVQIDFSDSVKVSQILFKR